MGTYLNMILVRSLDGVVIILIAYLLGWSTDNTQVCVCVSQGCENNDDFQSLVKSNCFV